jgi:hypothetical protein
MGIEVLGQAESLSDTFQIGGVDKTKLGTAVQSNG